MLVLQRLAGERIWIGEDVCIVALRVKGGKVKLGIEAPKGIKIAREEIRGKAKPSEGGGADCSGSDQPSAQLNK